MNNISDNSLLEKVLQKYWFRGQPKRNLKDLPMYSLKNSKIIKMLSIWKKEKSSEDSFKYSDQTDR